MLHVTETNPRPDGEQVPRTDANWREGKLRYDHSKDEELALGEGPEAEAAQARLRTKRDLALFALRG